MGIEYNPLLELDAFGNNNPNQDNDIGRPPSAPISSGDTSADLPPKQILQNLEGPYSIMGRSIVATND